MKMSKTEEKISNERIRKLRKEIKKCKFLKIEGVMIIITAVIGLILAEYGMYLMYEYKVENNLIIDVSKYILVAYCLAIIPMAYNRNSNINIKIIEINDKIYELGHYLYLSNKLDNDNKEYFKEKILLK